MKSLCLSYPAKFTAHKDDGETYYVVEIDQLNVVSEGDTLEDAMRNAQEALDCALLGALELNDDIPEPRRAKKNETLVSSSPEIAVPVLLKKSRKEKKKTPAEISSMMGCSLEQYNKIEKGRNITLKTLKKAATALGANIKIEFTLA